MYKKTNMLIHLLILTLFYVLFLTSYRITHPLFLAFICLTGMEVFLISNFYKSLLLTTCNAILSALIIIVYMTLHPDVLSLQPIILVDYILFSLICFGLWYLAYAESTLKASLLKYKNDLDYFYKLKKQEGLLSPEAFANEKAFILKATRRRNESCYYLYVKINVPLDHIALPSLMASLGIALVDTLRDHYDIIKKYEANSYLCLLQNVDDKNIKYAIRRLKNNLSDYFSDVDNIIRLDYYEGLST